MAVFSSDNFASDEFRALTWGLPGALTFPGIDPVPGTDATPAQGWYAADNGLVRAWAGFKRKNANDFRLFFLDLSPLVEIRGGDTISDTPAITLLAAPATISAGNYTAVPDENRVYFTLEGGVANQQYCLMVGVSLTSGARISRVVRVNVDEYI